MRDKASDEEIGFVLARPTGGTVPSGRERALQSRLYKRLRRWTSDLPPRLCFSQYEDRGT